MIQLNKIYFEDCLEGMKRIDTGTVDMILTDLPYGQTRNKWDSVIPFDPLWEQYERVIKDNGAIVLFANGMFTADLMKSNPKMWRYNLIWQKTQPSGFLNAKKMPLRDHEDICVFYKSIPTYNPQKKTGCERRISSKYHGRNSKETENYGSYERVTYDSTERYPKSVWTFPKDTQKSAITPTQKPLALCEALIKTYTNEKEIVLDSCAGSNTTGIACLNTNRYFISFENDHETYIKAVERTRKHEKQNLR